MTQDRLLRLTRPFNAAPERVFRAWTDPAWVKQWLFTSPQGQNDTRIDLRVGGKWRVADIQPDQTLVAAGEYLELAAPSRLAFTFSLPQFSGNADTITVDIAGDEAGSVMTFTQSGIDIGKELENTLDGEMSGSEQSWTAMFDTLTELVETGQVTQLTELSGTPAH